MKSVTQQITEDTNVDAQFRDSLAGRKVSPAIDDIRALILAAQNIALAGLKSGQEIGAMDERLRTKPLIDALRASNADLLEALENLENDDGSIPDHAWKLVLNAIAKATE